MNSTKLLSLYDKYTVLTTLCACILHLTGFGAIFYLVPLEWHTRNRGLQRYWTIVSTSLVVIVVVRLVQGRSLALTLFEAYIILALAGGLCALHTPFGSYFTQRRGLIRFSMVGFLFGVTTYPLLRLLLENAEWLSILERTVIELLNTRFATSISTVEVTDIVQQITNIILSSYLFVYAISVIGIWMIGEVTSNSALIKRRTIPHQSTFNIASFTIHPINIWFFIQIMSLYLLTKILLPWFHPLLVNMLLVGLVYYLLQGISIIYAMAINHIKLPNAPRVAVALLAACIIVPGINLLSIGILILLGISETWVVYKSRHHPIA